MKHKIKIHRKTVKILLVILLVVFVVLQLAYDWHVHQENAATLTGEPLTVSLIDDAVNNLNTLAPVDAQTGQIYFPDVKLMLPKPGSDYSLRGVEYSNASNGSTFELQVTTTDIVNLAENKLLLAQANAQTEHMDQNDTLSTIFKQVPNLQACTRGVQLFYSPQANSPDVTLQFSKKLSDGKTVYAYTDKTCQSGQMPALASYLKQIQSY